VEREFLNLDEREQGVRSVMAKMESGFIRRMVSFHMNDESQNKPLKPKPPLSQEVGAKAARKLQARRNTRTVWFGLGMMGLIGWSVAIPTLLGAALGLWLDSSIRAAIPGRWRCWWRARDRLFQCLALGAKEDKGHAGRTGGWR
jgi:predicted F0F1-ATPase subunit